MYSGRRLPGTAGIVPNSNDCLVVCKLDRLSRFLRNVLTIHGSHVSRLRHSIIPASKFIIPFATLA
jgi:hypothetical protein